MPILYTKDMRFRSLIARPLLLLAAFFFALGLQAYLWYQTLTHKSLANPKLSKADTCEDPEANAALVQKENPNKLLFISCGGFEE